MYMSKDLKKQQQQHYNYFWKHIHMETEGGADICMH